MFIAGLVLAIMVVPIVASICRELFLSVPHELEEGALALGATRWEMVRGRGPPVVTAGIAAAVILGLGRAIGEAIAVTQVIGGGPTIQRDTLRAPATRWRAGSPASSRAPPPRRCRSRPCSTSGRSCS